MLPGDDKQLIWTRGRADWPADQLRLAATLPPTLRPLHLPCIDINPLPLDLEALGRPLPTRLVLTSANAVDRLLGDPLGQSLLTKASHIYTHGEATGVRLSAAGLNPIVVPVRTAAELAAHLATVLPCGTSCLVLTAAKPATDVAALLTAKGLAAHTIACYETVAGLHRPDGSPPSPEELATWSHSLHGVVCFASPSAVDGFAQALLTPVNHLRQQLTAVAIGPTTAAAAAPHFPNVLVAATNSIRALIVKAVDALSI